MGKRKRSKNQNRRKGPQLSDGERLWKRLNSLFGNDEELWKREWDLQSLAKFIIETEKLSIRFSREAKAEQFFYAGLSQSVSNIRKEKQFFIIQENRKLVIRQKSVIEEIKNNVNDWRTFFSKYTGTVS